MAGTESHYILPLPSFDKPVRLLIVVSPYYKDIADNMVAGARAVAEKVGAVVDKIEVPARWRSRPRSAWPRAWPITTVSSHLAA